ncbi:MAG: glycosyltransferase family 2 protein [Microgenomates group bacterium]
MKKPKISVIIIGKNAKDLIKDCLLSVKWADEIIYLDGGSTDGTLEIVKEFKKVKIRFQKEKKMDFAEWHNQGIGESKGEWIFYLDTDERVTPELKKEISEIISKNSKEFSAYAIPRQNILLGRPVRFGGWWPDYQIRLFKRENLRKWEGKLHERPVFEGKLGYLKNPILHITHRDLSSMVEKTNQWSEIEAELLYKSGHPPMTWWRFLRIMLTEFWERGIKKQGWRDGVVGWIEIIYQMFSRFITYAKLWEKQKIKK